MNNIELITSHGNLKDGEVITFTENVIDRLSDNALFSIPKERLDLFRSTLTDYQLKLAKSKDGSKLDTLQKNDSKMVLTSLLDGLAVDLCVQAKGDRTKLATTGFTLIKEPEKRKQPSKPTKFTVENGINEGELIFSVAACKETNMYLFYYTPAPAIQPDPTSWKVTVATTHKLKITGFTHGVEYECRCAYQGSDKTLVFSDTVRKLAQ